MIIVFGAGAWLSVQIAGGPRALLEKLAAGQTAAVASLTHAIVLGCALLTSVLLLGAFYRLAVYRGAPRRVWPGVIATSLAGAGVSLAFAYYVQNLARFAVFYGSLAAVAIVLGWLYLLCCVFLAGAELNAVLDQEASLEDGRHRKASRKSIPETYALDDESESQRAAASGSGSTQTPQPSGSSAEA
jgi:membrane protein